MAYQALTLTFPEKPIAVIGLNRPAAANALNTQMALELKDIFAKLDTRTCRVVILTGEGKYFCAGADLKERKGMDETQWHTQHDAFEGALSGLMACPVPVIAAVPGAAFGGGLEMALACDFIYAAESARFALSETTLGIIPGLGGTQQLPRRVGYARARELIFTGRAFSAQEALEWGVVNRVLAPDALQQETLSVARAIAANAPLAVKAAKQSIENGAALHLKEALACELKQYVMLLRSKDRHEGIDAFNEKRKPVFTGE